MRLHFVWPQLTHHLILIILCIQGVDVMRHLDESAFYLATAGEGATGSSSFQLQIVDGAMVSVARAEAHSLCV